MDRAKFFAAVRSPLSVNKKAQVQGIDAILDEAERRGTPLAHLAAILAEAHHETGGAMQPVSENLNYSAKRLTEVWPSRFPTLAAAAPYANNPQRLANKVYGGRLGNVDPGDGWLFRGRGLAQITGRENYARFGIAGVPDDAGKMPVAVRILFDGMTGGIFTGRRLKDYDAAGGYRYAASRAIINGDVKANGARIEKYGRAFEAALRAAGYDAATPAAPVATGGFWAALVRFLLALLKGGKK
ncbi:lytic enzyme [Sinorhizobium sp. GW3]|nr:lytic enzyme [Sinorhizobium sp. GW3]